MRSVLTSCLIFSMMAGSALALGNVELRSLTPARVLLDGQYIGETPIILSDVQAGDHQIQVENPSTGELKTYLFRSPANVTISKVIDASFAVPVQQVTTVVQPAPQPVQQVAVLPQPVLSPVYRPTPSYRTVRYSPPRTWNRGSVSYPTTTPHSSRRQKAKVHTRNALLGIVGATQIFGGNHRDRKRQRNVGLGLLALNEILR
jgi:hypothetical protein